MKKILFLFLIITSLSFSTDLSGVHTIKVLELNSNKVLSHAKITVGQRSKYSNDNGIATIQLTDDEIFNGGEISIKIQKKTYKNYLGTIAIDNKNSTIYLEKTNIKQISNNKGNRKVRVMVTSKNSGTLYANSKKISNIKGGFDSSFYLTSERTEFTLDTDKAIYKKHSNLEERINHIEFTENDLYKLKEVKSPKKVVVKKPVPEPKPQQKETIKPKIIAEKKDVTNQDLITAIINPLKNNSAFNISGKVKDFNLEESNDGTTVFVLNNGNKSELPRSIVRKAKFKINENELLDDYILEEIVLDITLKSSYLNNIKNKLLNISTVKTNEKGDSSWLNNQNSKYFSIVSIEKKKEKILNNVYKVNYKISKKYYDFLKKLEDNYYQSSKQLKIETFAENKLLNVINVSSNFTGIKNINDMMMLGESHSNIVGDYGVLNNFFIKQNNYLFVEGNHNILKILFLKKKNGKTANTIKVSFIK